MSAKLFEIKKALCDNHTVNETSERLKNQWIEAFLLRLGIPKIMVDKRLKGDFGNSFWRDYLFNEFKINVYHDLASKKVSFFMYDEEKEINTKIGEWSKPEVIRFKKGDSRYCQLNLKYWQLI